MSASPYLFWTTSQRSILLLLLLLLRSINMTVPELKKFGKGFFFLSLNLAYTLTIMSLEYTVYYVLKEITSLVTHRHLNEAWLRQSGRALVPGAYKKRLVIHGDGFMSEIYR